MVYTSRTQVSSQNLHHTSFTCQSCYTRSARLAFALRGPPQALGVGSHGRPASASLQRAPLLPVCRIPCLGSVLHARTRLHQSLAPPLRRAWGWYPVVQGGQQDRRAVGGKGRLIFLYSP